jgi:histidyl-tRNA synthetase
MSQSVPPVRGINDILPDETPAWQWFEAIVRSTLQSYGYREIRVPLLERTELFCRSIGEVTDIVEKEMYTFLDRSGDSLTLRPEATASCVRAGISNGLLYNQQQRLWYAGPMFRYERPQKGRYRQFHQVGAEAFGFAGPDIDAEMILVAARLWRNLGLDGLRLELNSLGTVRSRQIYRGLLVEYFADHKDSLDDDSQRRLEKNPLRILDSKNPDMGELIAAAPLITDHLDPESDEHFAGLKEILTAAGVTYVVCPRLVRGLDYYTGTVFEWVTDKLGAQGAVCSGGRYDGLVEQLGGHPMPAIGWAMGVERIIELLRMAQLAPTRAAADAYLVPLGPLAESRSMRFAESLRDALPALNLQVHCGGGGIKSRMKRADRSGAELALIVGDEEVSSETVVIKPMRSGGEQVTIPVAEAVDQIIKFCPRLAHSE